jgi:putative spermidine/putrescine transport system permease protein
VPGRYGRLALCVFFGAFVLFLYGPTLTIMILSFQGPDGGLTFPMNGVSLHWFARLFERQAVGDIGGALQRSVMLGLMVMAATVLVSVSAGMAFRKRFPGAGALFTLTVASLIVPSILVSLGVGLLFSLAGWDPDWYSSAFGAQLTWTLPFGLLIMFAVLNRFDRRWEEAARDLGASPWQVFRHVVLPIVAPGIVGIALFGFTLSYDEFARTLLTAGSDNTLPLEIFGMTTNITTPVLYALGTLTTYLSAAVIVTALLGVRVLRKRRTTEALALE